MTLHPAYLWIGKEAQLHDRAFAFLKEQLCSQGGCDVCTQCRNITRKQHHLLLWITPENGYTLAQLEPVRETIVFALQPGEQFFIVLEHAELLNQACANSLLKSLEEPNEGYHFILLAQKAAGILPTIRSRCVVELLKGFTEHEHHPLAHFFMPASLTKVADLLRELEKARIPERDIPGLIDTLLQYWRDRLENAVEKGTLSESEAVQQVIQCLERAQLLTPMPGSSKIVLRNLFLQLVHAL